jgi:hypothetical protein
MQKASTIWRTCTSWSSESILSRTRGGGADGWMGLTSMRLCPLVSPWSLLSPEADCQIRRKHCAPTLPHDHSRLCIHGSTRRTRKGDHEGYARDVARGPASHQGSVLAPLPQWSDTRLPSDGRQRWVSCCSQRESSEADCSAREVISRTRSASSSPTLSR